jgi:hypothetical protein
LFNKLIRLLKSLGRCPSANLFFELLDRAIDHEMINKWQKTLSMTEYCQPRHLPGIADLVSIPGEFGFKTGGGRGT